MATPGRLTVLYDSGCPLCSFFRFWLAGQPVLVPLDLVPAESAEAHHRFPTLDHARTMEEITVVGDDGSIWTGAQAWVMCLWATATYRDLSERLARPGGLRIARGAALTAAGLRHLIGTQEEGDRDAPDYPGRCAGPACEAISQG